jgi:16S rRNA processing protein RimM
MEFFKCGHIMTTHGLRGDLKVKNLSDFDRFVKGNRLYILHKGDYQEVIVKTSKPFGDYLLVCFEGYEDINLIEMYRMVEIYKSTDDIEPLKEGEYYFRDLMNLKVYVDDNCVGTVVDVEEGRTSNFIRVKKNDNTEALVPFLPVFIKSVSLNEGKIVLNYIEGLL